MLKQPATRLVQSQPTAAKKPAKELPAGSGKLLAEAQGYFAAHEYDKAEATYQQIVRMDEKNVTALANLAAIQLEAQHYDAAESNLKKAVALEPDDAYSQYMLGALKYRQGRYDEAIDELGRAAKLDSQNADLQTYLGLALSRKGQRGPAEAALRKAILLQPNNAGAHYNLALVYLSQQPPALELARFHYQKALAAGHPSSPDFEKKLDQR